MAMAIRITCFTTGSTRQTAIWYLNNNVLSSGLFGPTLPVGWTVVGVADFNGDGKPDYLLYNGSTRRTVIWYLNNNVQSSGLFGPGSSCRLKTFKELTNVDLKYVIFFKQEQLASKGCRDPDSRAVVSA